MPELSNRRSLLELLSQAAQDANCSQAAPANNDNFPHTVWHVLNKVKKIFHYVVASNSSRRLVA
jgi:hypothetical protein